MAARYATIPSNYASNVLSVFEQLTSITTSPPILIGAITDGNSDPRNVPELSGYFDFCINAESVGVAKPDQRVYRQAMDYVRNHPTLQDRMMVAGEETAGPWWIHIGDDFSKDIVAAKNLNMRTIWAQELILDKLEKTKETITAQYSDDDANTNKEIVSPEKELLQFQEKINSQTVVKMSVGAEDYLMSSIQQEFADAVIDDFSDLPNVLQKWHGQSMRQPTQVYVPDEADLVNGNPNPQSPAPSVQPKTPGGVYVPDEADLVNGNPPIPPQPPSVTKETPSPKTQGEVYVPEEADLVKDLIQRTPPATKFCTSCGAKIPMAAAFCSSCGEKQPAWGVQ